MNIDYIPFFVFHPLCCLRSSFLSPSHVYTYLVVMTPTRSHMAGSSPPSFVSSIFIARCSRFFSGRLASKSMMKMYRQSLSACIPSGLWSVWPARTSDGGTQQYVRLKIVRYHIRPPAKVIVRDPLDPEPEFFF